MTHHIHHAAIQALVAAVEAQSLVALDCKDTTTGETVVVVCSVIMDRDGTVKTLPLAKLFDSNPLKFLAPPTDFQVNNVRV